VYAALARAVLDPAHAGEASARVERLRRRYPRASRDALARRLIHRTALQCGVGGAILAGPAAFFGGLPFGIDLSYQVVALNRLVLSLAALYGSAPSLRDTGAGAAAGAAAALASEALRQALVSALRRSLPRRPAARAAVGAALGGVLGYAAARLVGEAARGVFAGRPALPRRLRRRE
jgi:hypothetical protein